MFRDSIDIDYDSDLLFQISDWYQKDVEDDDDNRSYIIKIFGVSEEGYSICVNILDFEPYFYITHKKKTSLNIFEINQLSTQLTNMLPASFKEDFDIVSESKKSLWGFTNNTYKQYIKLSFRNLTCMYILRKFLRNQKKYEFHE